MKAASDLGQKADTIFILQPRLETFIFDKANRQCWPSAWRQHTEGCLGLFFFTFLTVHLPFVCFLFLTKNVYSCSYLFDLS